MHNNQNEGGIATTNQHAHLSLSPVGFLPLLLLSDQFNLSEYVSVASAHTTKNKTDNNNKQTIEGGGGDYRHQGNQSWNCGTTEE